MKYLVQYRVEDAGIQQVGPYEEGEAQLQLADIAGFEGIQNAHLIPASDEAEPPHFNQIGFIPTSIGD